MMLHLAPHYYEYHERPITPQRLAAARRRLNKQRQKMPLFAFEITATPEQSIEEVDRNAAETKRRLRRWYAGAIKNLRYVWRSISEDERARLVDAWAKSSYPKTASYALEWLRKEGYCTITGFYNQEEKRFEVIVVPTLKIGSYDKIL